MDEVTTLVGVRAEGTQFVYDMAITRDVDPEELASTRDAAQARNQATLCADPPSRRLFEMGGSMRHIYTDPSGDRFETLVTACPG